MKPLLHVIPPQSNLVNIRVFHYWRGRVESSRRIIYTSQAAINARVIANEKEKEKQEKTANKVEKQVDSRLFSLRHRSGLCICIGHMRSSNSHRMQRWINEILHLCRRPLRGSRRDRGILQELSRFGPPTLRTDNQPNHGSQYRRKVEQARRPFSLSFPAT